MAWTTVGTTNLTNTNNVVVGYVYLQYDTASSGSTWATRLVTGARSGYSFNVAFLNVTLDGNNQGTKTGVTQNSVVIWTGNLSGGRTISGSWTCTWSGGNKNYTISGALPAKGSAPTGGSVTFNSSTWNTINATSGVTSWGGLTGNIHLMVVTGETNGDADSYTSYSHARRGFHYNGTNSTSYTFSATDSSTSATYDGTPLSIKGLLHYKLGYYNYNSVGNVAGLDNTLRYLPPAMPLTSYTDPGGAGAKTYPVVVEGDTTNNFTTYDSASLTRTVRYKIDNGGWTYVIQNVVTALDTQTTFSVTVPAASTATIESWESYHGGDSATRSVTITNSNLPAVLYGSVNGRAKALGPVYGSVGGQTKKLVKIYASVNGVAKKIYQDTGV